MRASDAFHAALADDVIGAKVDMVLLVGEEMTALAKALEGKAEFAHGSGIDFALAWLREELRAGDAVLVKGSNSIGLSRIVSALTGGDI